MDKLRWRISFEGKTFLWNWSCHDE